jgi:ABC-2 type transport system permease protein
VSLFLHELRAQQRLFWRSRELAFFTVLLPIVFFVLLASVYGDRDIDGVRGADYVLAGMVGYGAVATTFAGLAILLVIRRESGTLKRVRATPLPAGTYVAAVLVSTLIAFVLEAAALLAIGRAVFGTDAPERIVSLALTLLLGAAAFAALGVALSGLVRSAEGSSAVVNAIYLPMAFVSGAFFSPAEFPRFVQAVAEVLPLTYFIRLLRETMLEGAQLWHEPGSAAVVAGWGLVGLLVVMRRFRWEPVEG